MCDGDCCVDRLRRKILNSSIASKPFLSLDSLLDSNVTGGADDGVGVGDSDGAVVGVVRGVEDEDANREAGG